MIQSLLFFVLGFLTAALLALMVAPAVWRRAAALTRKRIEATVPMTLNEIQAEKDRMRADFAMAARRLEMNLQSHQEKLAGQAVELGRNREEIKLLAEECSAKSHAIGELEAQASGSRAELRKRDEEIEKLAGRVADADRRLEERALEVERLERELDEASFASSNRQIELVARETEVDKLVGDINILRNQQRDTERRTREIASENKAAQEALRAERKRLADAEKKLERLMSAASDGEDRLDRREKELMRLREEAKRNAQTANELRTRVTELEKLRDQLQAQLADRASGGAPATGGNGAAPTQEHAKERARLEERMTALVRENKKLRAELSEPRQPQAAGAGQASDSELRAQIQGLAAEMVNLTAALEGPDSPVRKALSREGDGGTAGISSLADRIRALQKAVPSGSSSSRPS